MTAGGDETALTPSVATFNAQSVTLTDQNNGTYSGTYTVTEGHNDITNAEATAITLTDVAGNISAAGASSGNTVVIDANSPVLLSATGSNSGTPAPGIRES